MQFWGAGGVLCALRASRLPEQMVKLPQPVRDKCSLPFTDWAVPGDHREFMFCLGFV